MLNSYAAKRSFQFFRVVMITLEFAGIYFTGIRVGVSARCACTTLAQVYQLVNIHTHRIMAVIRVYVQRTLVNFDCTNDRITWCDRRGNLRASCVSTVVMVVVKEWWTINQCRGVGGRREGKSG